MLFSGEPGTGKTTAAIELASALTSPLLRIETASVISKYIGETEKNLDPIFKAAASAGAVLFFDEADALFGKRAEVKDAHDRCANVESSYLLGQLDRFNGVVVLATNRRDDIDRAFLGEILHVVKFPLTNAG